MPKPTKKSSSKKKITTPAKKTAVDKRAIGNLLRAVQRKKLTPEQHELLQDLIVEIERMERTKSGLGVTVRYNLEVVDTQIRDVLAKTGGKAFDENAIAKMPDHIQARIIERLENVTARLESEATRERIKSYSDDAFKCVDDYELCKQNNPGAKYWCTIALLVCLASQVARSIVPPRKK